MDTQEPDTKTETTNIIDKAVDLLKDDKRIREKNKNYTVNDFRNLGKEGLIELFNKFGKDIFNKKTQKFDAEGKPLGIDHKFRPELLSTYFSIMYYIKTVSPSYYKLPHDMYSYQPDIGIYVSNTEDILEKKMKEIYIEDYTSKPVESVFDDIRASTKTKRPQIDEHPYHIPMGRDTIHIMKKEDKYFIELEKHNPDRFTLIAIPHDYHSYDKDGNIDTVREENGRDIFVRYIYSVLPNEQDRNSLQEFLGIALFRLQLYNLILILLGKSKSGKTTLLNVIRNVLGRKNCSSISLAKMATERFAVAELDNKLLNIADDLNSGDISDVSQIKQITGGTDALGVEKKFKDLYDITPIAKHIFSCNQLPPIIGADTAFYNRFSIIKFNQSFPKEDEFLDKKLNTEDVNSYILRWAMIGLIRVLDNHGFTHRQTAKEVAEIWGENNANPLVAFSKSNKIIYDPYGLYMFRDLEIDVIEFAKNRILDELGDENKLPTTTEIGRFFSIMKHVSKENHRYNGEQKVFYRGIRPNRITDYPIYERDGMDNIPEGWQPISTIKLKPPVLPEITKPKELNIMDVPVLDMPQEIYVDEDEEIIQPETLDYNPEEAENARKYFEFLESLEEKPEVNEDEN